MDSIFSSIIETGLTFGSYLICSLVALICGVICALCADFRTRITKSFFASLVMLPMIVNTVILMVNGNIGTGVAVMGAFSLVRFRSVPGRARDIACIFAAMTAGLACASGFVFVALIFTSAICAVSLVIDLLPVRAGREMDLRITVPESLNYSGSFDDLFEAYTKSHRLVSVKTSGMGSLYKLSYKVELKSKDLSRELIDSLRQRNGNLEILLCEAEERGEEL